MSIERIQQLTTRQREVLRLHHRRLRVKEIAGRLGISDNTASGYLTEAAALLGVGGRQAAAAALAAYEATHPEARGRFSVGDENLPSPPVDPVPAASVPASTMAEPPRRWGFPISRRVGNELSIVERLLWIFALAVAFAVGFGMLSVGLRVVGEVLLAVSGSGG